ncbi:hypothetical protein, partial [Asaia bogorensis]|uniref:hypothetical protein n=1 Tax=Asaia bogorensis TaxID=91915 RepID=UPI00196938F3
KANQNQTIDPETKKLTSVVLSKKNKSVSTLIIRTTGSDNTKAPPTYPFHNLFNFQRTLPNSLILLSLSGSRRGVFRCGERAFRPHTHTRQHIISEK